MNRLRRRLIDWNNEGPGPRVAEYLVIAFVFALIAFTALALASGQTSVILSTVSQPI